MHSQRIRRFAASQGGWRLLISALLLPLLLLGLRPAHAQELVLRQALAVASDAAEFPSHADAAAVQLPDHWASSRPGFSGAVWYRFKLEGGSSQLLRQALYIEQVCSNYQLWVNGVSLVARGRMLDPISERCFEPQLIELPPGLLRAAGNVIDIKVAGYAKQVLGSSNRAASLSAVELGELETLAKRQARAWFWQQTLPLQLSAMLVLMALTLALLALRHARDQHLLFLAGLMACWVLFSNRLWIGDIPWPRALVEVLIASLLPLLTLCAVQYLLRALGRQDKRIDQVLLLQALIAPTSLALTPLKFQFVAVSLWSLVLAAQILGALGWHLRQQWQRAQGPHSLPRQGKQQRRQWWITTALLGLAALSVLLELAAQQFRAPAGASLTAVVVPLVMLGMGLQAVLALAHARQEAEAMQHQLEQHVQERVADIERHYNQMAELKLEQVTERERKRIAADLHDDLGAKLLTIVHTSESDRISTLAREALEEMRLSVRGLTGKPVQLLDALGDWRAEVVSRLAQANILAEWKAPAEDIVHTLPARAYVQTTRIFREAVSNIIKHSGGTHCVVSCSVEDGYFIVVIQDNGQGIPMELDGRLDRGHGMASMKARAKQMHGQCLVESGPGWGTVIRLTIPL